MKQNEWQLEDFQDALETSEVEGKIQIREHFVFARRKKVPATESWREQVGESTRQLDYYIGAVSKKKRYVRRIGGTPPTSDPLYICVLDGIAPEQPDSPGDYIVRRQVWEYYGKWEDAPDGWGV